MYHETVASSSCRSTLPEIFRSHPTSTLNILSPEHPMPLDKRCSLILQERVGPVGNSGLRRPSRSPRSQRSRSADVDCLKKYTERRVEERRYTEISDASKLDTSKWTPLPRNLPRGQQVSPGSSKRLSRDERQDSVEESATGIERWPANPSLAETSSEDPRSSVVRIDHELTVPRPPGTRSHSTDVTALRGHDKRSIEQRRHTDCSDPRTIATRLTAHIFHIRKREMP